MARFPLLCILVTALVLGGCSDDNSAAPDVDRAHPPNWTLAHAPEARGRAMDCTLCHGDVFQGAGEAVSCYACHFDDPTRVAQVFVHPPDWVNVIIDHQDFPLQHSWTTCANGACHGGELRGGLAGPSCFAAGCHAQGPPSPHPAPTADQRYVLPQNHGPDARDNVLYCRNCHGRPPNIFDGGFVSDPRIVGAPFASCSASFCHPAAGAHPTHWQGENDPTPAYASSHRPVGPQAVEVGCALCHRTEAPGPGPIPAAPSCFSAQFTNTGGSTTGCHPGGP